MLDVGLVEGEGLGLWLGDGLGDCDGESDADSEGVYCRTECSTAFDTFIPVGTVRTE